MRGRVAVVGLFWGRYIVCGRHCCGRHGLWPSWYNPWL